jgi:signal transduction histidine kinase
MQARPIVGDSLIAGLLGLIDLAIFVGGTLTHQPGVKPWYIVIPFDIVMVVPLAFRRRYPLAVAYLTLLIAIPHSALELGVGSAVGGMIGLYSAAVYVGRRQAALFVGVLVLVGGGQLMIEAKRIWPVDVLFTIFAMALCWLLGEFVGARRAYQLEVEARLHLLETERDQAARIAVGEERGRIARELHDVVAHAVSVIVVQADGASYAISSNPELAGRAIATISETGRGALEELRRLLDVLRNDESDGEPRVPQPNAEALVELADRVRAAGLPVDLEIDGDLGGLPAGVSLGVYRIVQESLTNSIKHAGRGAKACVRIYLEDDVVHIKVLDDGGGRAPVPVATNAAAAVPGGNGLIGMRERAHVFGGSLHVGPVPGGGWRVHAELPIRLSA